MRKGFKWGTVAISVACLVLVLGTTGSAATTERFTGLIVTGGQPTEMIMSIKGWTSDADAKALKATLASGGPDAAKRAVEKTSMGYISLIGSMGWPINVARAYAAPNGGRRIVLLTDRPIMNAEALAQSVTLDYPFGIIELQIDSKGEGKGSIIGMARITIDDKGVINVDPYAGYAYEMTRVRLSK